MATELHVIEVGQGDIAASTVVHIPSIDTVVAGDVAYNRIHPMLSFTGVAGWQGWIDSLDLIAGLGAKTIVAGHKAPQASDGDIATIIDGTRDYIRDFRDAAAACGSPDELIEIIKNKYGGYGNLTTLRYSARAAFPRSG